jgi:GNAT superfamily N-acetyltransferase
MSFWKNNTHAPSWSEMVGQVWNQTPPRLLETIHLPRRHPNPNGWFLRRAEVSDLVLLPEFWARWFSISKACRCAITLSHIQKQVLEGKWEVYVCIRFSGELIGTIVRRWIRGVHVREVSWARAGGIDYFCIHPAWRNKGVGRALLAEVHNRTPAPIMPHFIFWEGFTLSVPPLSCGVLYAKQCLGGSVGVGGSGSGGSQATEEKENRSQIWKSLVRGADIWSEEIGDEISLWKTVRGYVAIWNTFHRSIPGGAAIGIVIASQSAEAVNLIGAPWGVLLSDTSHGADWSFDSPFQWIGYNLGVGFISLQFPRLGF